MNEINNLLINQYVIVRTYAAGVFAGTLVKKEGNEVELKDARRLWYWAGASSLSQLAEEGVKRPKDCKFPQEVAQVILINTIEILKVTEKAKLSIASVNMSKNIIVDTVDITEKYLVKALEEIAEKAEKPKTIFPFVTPSMRKELNTGIKGVIVGKAGVGKTSLLLTLPEESTLFVNIEAGELAVKEWGGVSYKPQTWEDCRNFAVLLGGPDESLKSDQPYSREHYKAMVSRFGDPEQFNQFETIFIDSITEASRLSFRWASKQPECITAKGLLDNRAVYGLHGKEMMNWLMHLQKIPNKNIWFVGILEDKLDDLNKPYFSLQMEGQKAGLELPGIVDEMITMYDIYSQEHRQGYKAFICHSMNPYGLPAKDRTGKLDMIEPPHLGKLMDKIRNTDIATIKKIYELPQ